MSVERKLATVLFVDLVDSTSLVAGIDPEIARRRVTQFFESVSHCVTTHGGIVEKFAGDAVLAAFGIPQAHEDDAERAVRAGLAMLDSVHELGLEARVGIDFDPAHAGQIDDEADDGLLGEIAASDAEAANFDQPGQLARRPHHDLPVTGFKMDTIIADQHGRR